MKGKLERGERREGNKEKKRFIDEKGWRREDKRVRCMRKMT